MNNQAVDAGLSFVDKEGNGGEHKCGCGCKCNGKPVIYRSVWDRLCLQLFGAMPPALSPESQLQDITIWTDGIELKNDTRPYVFTVTTDEPIGPAAQDFIQYKDKFYVIGAVTQTASDKYSCTGCIPIDVSIIAAYVAMVDTEGAVETAEFQRSQAEVARVLAEADRAAAELDRVNSEEGRVLAEADRSVAEHERSVAETARRNAETARQDAEAARQAAENERIGAEQLRRSAESRRVVQAYDDHVRAEQDHQGAVEMKEWFEGLGPATEEKDGLMSAEDKYKLDHINENDVEKLTYAELASRRQAGTLVPGKSYRITDYVATTIQAGTRSANHPFDIIVTAVTETTLSEEARAAVHEGDTYFTSKGAKLESWELKYCFDNDVNRFAWADVNNGKGVVYRMIDEWDNNVPFDFKSIQFKRHRVTAKAAYQEQFSCIDGLYVGVPGLDFGVLDIDANDYKWYYTFSQLGATFSDEIEDASFCDDFVTRDNDFDIDRGRDIPILTDMVFANGVALQTLMSSLGTPYSEDKVVCVNTHYYESSNQLTMFGITANNFASSQFRRNLSIGICRHSSFGTDCQGNFILVLQDFSFVTVGEICEGNVLKVKRLDYCSVGNYFKNNKLFISEVCQGCTAGHLVYQNTFTGDIHLRNYFFGLINGNTFGPMSNCFFEGQTVSCEFNSEMANSTFGSRLAYIVVPEVSEKGFRAVDVRGNMRGTSSAKIALDNPAFFLTDDSGVSRRVAVEGDTAGNIVATWMDDGKMVGVMKEAGGNTWTEIQGGGEPEIFLAEYGVTTYAEIVGAANAGKEVICENSNGGIYHLVSIPTNGAAAVFTTIMQAEARLVRCTAENAWSGWTTSLEVQSSRVQTITGNESATNKYPSTKAVADAIALVDKVFPVTYEQTAIADIQAAVAAGKIPVCIKDSQAFVFAREESNQIIFSCIRLHNEGYIRITKSTGVWYTGAVNLENPENKTGDIDANKTSNAKYPTVKAVYDALPVAMTDAQLDTVFDANWQ